jgi:two-component system chemotaxis response regulator CheB
MIAIGGSAGALEPLTTLVKQLPRKIPAALFVVLHTSPESNGCLPQILERSGNLPARFPAPAEPIQHGQIYVAPPNQHLMVAQGDVVVVDGPRENGFRPAIDPLFRSLAQSYAGRAAGVILSGALDDGTFGLMAIKEAGGLAVVQHPYEALVPSMPLSAIQNVEVDHIVRSDEIARLLLHESGASGTAWPAAAAAEPGSGDRDISLNSIPPDQLAGQPSHFTCPECGGSLWEIQQGQLSRYRCHTGHGFTPQTLLSEQNVQLETALWSAVRSLAERAALHRKLADQAEERQMMPIAESYRARAAEEDDNAAALRRLLAPHPAAAELPPPPPGQVAGVSPVPSPR